MNNPSIREILIEYQEEQVLREYLGANYETTTASEKQRFINVVKKTIEREVDNILQTFVDDVQKGSPERRRRKKLSILNLVITALATPGIAYSVNIENWIVVVILSLILLTIQGYLIIND